MGVSATKWTVYRRLQDIIVSQLFFSNWNIEFLGDYYNCTRIHHFVLKLHFRKMTFCLSCTIESYTSDCSKHLSKKHSISKRTKLF